MIVDLEFKKKLYSLLLAQPGKVTAFFLAFAWLNKYGEPVDWHIFSDALGLLYRVGVLDIVEHTSDGMTVYQLRKE